MTSRQDPEQRFDEELRRAARALVTEEMPRGILDPALADARSRRALPGFAPVVAIAILLAATAVAISPGGIGPTPTPTPVPSVAPTEQPIVRLRTTTEIRLDLSTLGYTCAAGRPLPSIGPGADVPVRESAICLSPAELGPLTAAVIVEETAGGKVVELHAKADIVGEDTATARAAVASALAKAAAIGTGIAGAGNEVGTWVNETVPTIKPSGGENKIIRGYDVKIARNANGGYLLIIHVAIV